MRWYARPEGDNQQLRVAPRLASWDKADDPDEVRLRAFSATPKLCLLRRG